MMNPESLMQEIADGLEQAVREGWTRAHVCLFDNEIGVLKTSHTTNRHPIFATFEYTTLLKGLTSKQWLSLIHKICAYFKDSKQCPPLLKHSRQQIATFCLDASSKPKAPPPSKEKG